MQTTSRNETTTTTRPIGPRMANALHYVASRPRVSKHEVATAVGPHGSNRYGDMIVLRCLRRGLLRNAAPAGAFRYELEITDAGREAIR